MQDERAHAEEKPADAAPVAADATPEAAPQVRTAAVKERKPKRKYGLALYLAWCKRCAICGEFCPTGALVNDEVGTPSIADEDKCAGCMQCMYRCPDFCVEVFEKKAANAEGAASAAKKEDAA